ncbi:MAG: apolipoprotein N-acyltransferase [Candidatus Omnitrophica bacterium]|nr:apolipoprotein N-acyltransferase [Candidatus Omnitrophota bacterium]
MALTSDWWIVNSQSPGHYQPYSFLRTPYLYQIASGFLLALSFPFPGWGFLAWFALVPLLASLHHAQNNSQALGFGLISGIIYFFISLHWLTYVSTVGWLLLALMESVSVMVFAWLAYVGMKSQKPVVFKALWIALGWTVTEILRSEIPVFGFGWNLLAYSQSPYLRLIQFANVIGAYGLGFLIAWVNAAIFCAWFWRKERKTVLGLVVAGALVLAGLWGYGNMTLAKPVEPKEYLRVSVLQGNIPQSVKWEPMAREKILEIYEKLTQLAALEQPDLILWPEAAFPGYFNRDIQAERIARLAAEVQTPFLIGGLEWESENESYNSAYFLGKDGALGQRYDKLRLVPFGEYIPLKPVFGWLTPVADALGISDFHAGKESVVFRWAREDWPFGVLICFEDVFSDLARDLTDGGAKFLAVITNDAWFGKTSAPFQHLQASIFRAVENGVAVVRAANTGVSGFVSHQGRVLATVKDERGDETFVMGQKTFDLPLVSEWTLFRQGGFLFPCFAVACFLIFGLFVFKKNKNHE